VRHDARASQGVRFTQEPTAIGPVTTAVLDGTCGNLVEIATRPPKTENRVIRPGRSVTVRGFDSRPVNSIFDRVTV
jgi:hypothetical protein